MAVIVLTGTLAQGQVSREVLWLEGPGLTSLSWIRAEEAAKRRGYKYFRFDSNPYDWNTTSQSIPEWAEYFNSKGRTDVLGIGHDAGGLILRKMNALSPNSGLSAMILDGVPNQGSRLMRSLVPNAPDLPSEAQVLINKLLDLKTQAQGCNGCRMLEAVQRWINSFIASERTRTYYSQMWPTSPLIQDLGLPTIPYAVIWGNEDESDGLILTRLVASWGSVYGQDTEYLDCYRREIAQRVRDASDHALVALMQGVAGLAGSLAKISTSKGDVGKIGEAISGAISTVANGIRARQTLDKELREAFECELIHQALNAQWNLAVSPYSLVQDTIFIPCIPCDNCADDPDPQVVGYCFSVCTAYGCQPLELLAYPVEYYTFEPHDGLLTRSEQLLQGAAKTYEARKVNHFQEQFWEYTPIGNAFQDLFNGGAGAAFVVPK